MLHQVGAGALGPVFRAFDPERDRLVAVKRFQLDVPPERVHQLVAEFERLIAAQLTHPILAAPVATGIDGTVAYLASEYVSADSLDIVVREYGQAPPLQALRVAAQLAGALDFAAVVNVYHGALHARDVLLSSDDTRLTGIGVASALERIGVAAPVRRPYSAPERIAGGDWDRRADIFSLAALIHELLWARRIAGTGAAAADALVPIDGGRLPALRDVFARALAEDPASRFGTALEFAEALQAAFPDVAQAPRTTAPTVAPAATPAAPPRVEPERRDVIDAPLRLPLDLDLDDGRAAPAMEPPAPPVIAPARAAEPDLPLRPATPRYGDVERTPIIPVPLGASVPRPVPVPDLHSAAAAAEPMPQPEFMASALEHSRSAIWPLVLALVVGVALGFAGGYSVGSRDRERTPAAAASTVAPSATPPATTATTPPGPAASTPNGSDAATSDAPTSAAAAEPPAVAPVPPPAEPPAPAASRENTRKAQAPVEAGALLVRSTPAGARVFVDGHEYGKTPIAVRELGRGTHRVRIVHDGFSTEERRVALSGSRPTQSMLVPLVPLTRPRTAAGSGSPRSAGSGAAVPGAAGSATSATVGRFAGTLTVDSRPTAAKVYIDGVLIGTTPLQLPDVSAGEHAVRLEHDGYRTWSSSVRVVASETNRVTASLEK